MKLVKGIKSFVQGKITLSVRTENMLCFVFLTAPCVSPGVSHSRALVGLKEKSNCIFQLKPKIQKALF